MVNHTPKPKVSMHKNNGYPCNNFINHVIYFKSNALRITERYTKWSFPNDKDYNMTLLFFHSDLYKERLE